MSKLITSQDYLNEEIIDRKIADQDFSVLVSPVFLIDGEEYQVVLDGHHSLAAAVKTGNEPEFEIAKALRHDAVGLLDVGNVDDFLSVTHMGSDYRDAITEEYVW